MKNKCPNTKLKIILAAGELFAESGFDAVTTRNIAQKAQTNLGSLHYHFKNKEDLYLQTIKYIVENKEVVPISETIENDPDILNRPQDISSLIAQNIWDYFYRSTIKSNPAWGPKLIHRESVNPNQGWQIIYKEFILPLHNEYYNLYRHFKPTANENEAHFLGFIIQSQMALHCLFKETAAQIIGSEKINENFYKEMAWQTALIMTNYMELPKPQKRI